MTELDILVGCQNGDAPCQRALVGRYSPWLFSVAKRYMGESEAAKDVLQDSLVKIFNNIHTYKPTGSFEAWMRRIVVNTALKALDKTWVRHIQSVEDYPESAVEQPTVYADLNAEVIMEIIESLPSGYREVFNLCAIEQMTHAEIAKLLSISESTSRSQFYRARLMIQQILVHREIMPS
jgi:RNA polymerase sigma factor (sigma-70 family)